MWENFVPSLITCRSLFDSGTINSGASRKLVQRQAIDVTYFVISLFRTNPVS